MTVDELAEIKAKAFLDNEDLTLVSIEKTARDHIEHLAEIVKTAYLTAYRTGFADGVAASNRKETLPPTEEMQ